MSLRGKIEIWLVERWYGKAAVPMYLHALAAFYAAVLNFRRKLYAWGFKRSTSVSVPVVVVGNLTVGGTGKTPVVAALALSLTDRGWKPGILSRGYRAAKRSAAIVPATASASQFGDEPVWLSRSTGVPVAIGQHRVRGAKLLVAAGCDVIISDDGLQHWALARDLEILVIDGERRFGNGLLLPAGPLREPASRAQRVDWRMLNGGQAAAGEIALDVQGSRIVKVGEVAETRLLRALRGQQVHAVAGIGNPERFFRMLESQGLIVHRHPWPDHHHFDGRELHFDDELMVLVTEKDAVKVAQFAHPNLYAVPIEVHLPDAFINALQEKLCALRASSSPYSERPDVE